MSAISAPAGLAQRLAAIVGDAYVATDDLPAIQGVTPEVAVSPANAEQVAEVMRLAWADGLVVVPYGSGANQDIGPAPDRVDILLRTSRLTQVDHYDPGDLTLGIGVGTTVTSVQQMVGEHRQMFAVEPLSPQMTVGGALATAWHGPLKHAYGGVRDFCIGIHFVTADGKIAKGGGRVVKNVAGYDLMKLLIGSHGTLGVITAASFKLFPAPRQTTTFLCQFAKLSEAVSLRDRLLQSPLTPMCLEIVSPHAHGALSGGAEESDSWRVLVRAAGSDATLARYRAIVGSAVTRELEGEAEPLLWSHLSNFVNIALERGHNSAVLRVDVPIQDVERVVGEAERAALDNNFLPAIVGRAGCGSLLVALMPIAVDPPSVNQYINAISAQRTSLDRHGSATVLRCPQEAKRHVNMWGSTPNDMGVMKAMKSALDEKNILNRGRFLF